MVFSATIKLASSVLTNIYSGNGELLALVPKILSQFLLFFVHLFSSYFFLLMSAYNTTPVWQDRSE